MMISNVVVSMLPLSLSLAAPVLTTALRNVQGGGQGSGTVFHPHEWDLTTVADWLLANQKSSSGLVAGSCSFI